MKKYILLITLFISLLTISGCVLIKDNKNANQALIQPLKEILLIIDNQPYKIDNNRLSDTSVYDALLSITAQNKIKLQTKEYDFGILIEAIGDKTNGQDNKYWLYYINGEMPMVAVNNYKLNPGDKVEFKFEESKF
ncbi:hypothetical protein A3B87_00145 [Candidatus Kuenenbacteria bacterium RIFCSPHIGHO2_02_FULL_39_13]|uniref:Transcobalamin-like C-terminal domain-containing protein n=1 Tax=Candidatus Kuenenbacteria bacterium RIFCSPHIGHO2_02_FULL_39_13 TaxID=1798561 RepID=A0A1F6FN28_9BACT|nr:MAG: hypothetical protein A3B87_00145 [Candidatus Kuenenbacteria bacterium RIFCSPHIGHO2_02_FULL_39_13]